MVKKYDYYVGDFETVVEDNPRNQIETAVWASALVQLYSEECTIFHSINETISYLLQLKRDSIVYYHNLKFDGSFYIDWFLRHGYRNSIIIDPKTGSKSFKKEKDLDNMEFSYLYTDTGLMYQLVFRNNNRTIKLIDSYKILPYSVEKLGKDFKTKHQKSTIEYKGFRYPGCVITDEEKEYIKNDVLVVKECIEIMHNEGHKKITIGSNCMSEYKDIFNNYVSDGFFKWKDFFPQLHDIQIDQSTYGCSNAFNYILRSYRGGWVYLKRGCENKVISNGSTYDVNSEYPSNMHSKSGNYYPVGTPNFFTCNIPEEAHRKDRYYFITIRCSFTLKDRKLPFIQIKNDKRYNPRKMLESSTTYDGISDIVELTLTQTDYDRFLEYYNVDNFEILHGCWFYATKGLFDPYIDKWMYEKENNTGAKKGIAKLYLNNLYGKFATGVDSSFKIFYLDTNGNIVTESVKESNKQAGYIAVGSAVTSYSRDFIIRHAQANYDTFIYADTDSMHLIGRKANMVKVHPTKLLHWKCESYWDQGLFVRSKTYIEHITHENEKPIDKPYYNMRCAGLPKRCKNLFLKSCGVDTDYEFGKLLPSEEKFLEKERKITDFKVGIRIPGKLKQKRIKGGIILYDEEFLMKKG